MPPAQPAQLVDSPVLSKNKGKRMNNSKVDDKQKLTNEQDDIPEKPLSDLDFREAWHDMLNTCQPWSDDSLNEASCDTIDLGVWSPSENLNKAMDNEVWLHYTDTYQIEDGTSTENDPSGENKTSNSALGVEAVGDGAPSGDGFPLDCSSCDPTKLEYTNNIYGEDEGSIMQYPSIMLQQDGGINAGINFNVGRDNSFCKNVAENKDCYSGSDAHLSLDLSGLAGDEESQSSDLPDGDLDQGVKDPILKSVSTITPSSSSDTSEELELKNEITGNTNKTKTDPTEYLVVVEDIDEDLDVSWLSLLMDSSADEANTDSSESSVTRNPEETQNAQQSQSTETCYYDVLSDTPHSLNDTGKTSDDSKVQFEDALNYPCVVENEPKTMPCSCVICRIDFRSGDHVVTNASTAVEKISDPSPIGDGLHDSAPHKLSPSGVGNKGNGDEENFLGGIIRRLLGIVLR